MVVFAIVSSICQQAIYGQMAAGLANRGRKLGRILAGTITNYRPSPQVGSVMVHQGQFRPAVTQKSLVTDAIYIVPGSVTGFQAGGINRRLSFALDQADFIRFVKDDR